MKSWQFFVALLLGVVCVALSVATVATARSNQLLQREIQNRQNRLSAGILGPQSQQITTSLLQDMAALAVRSAGLRNLLAKHGYNISVPEKPAATNAVRETVAEDVTKAKEEK